ncbi:hypothetical protein BJ875DRAFT_501177 [Amylocarpus encephaloides]|uniref:Uncharacterized protein n=1 Tax=Amylocarpus encephaloides TaxID=45428 RepID=A0A9P8CAP5_9HELO|nr:hypothetical protein BJ875DRAFT_501177 [Amylocarpus encephaloides]
MSDNFEQIRIFGLLPFGGGGIFISLPLAARLTQPRVWQACMELPNDQGDQIVDQCLKKHSQTRTTFDPYLHQMDFRGDENVAAGYYESGRQMLSVHHWRHWYPLDMPAVAYVGKACGDEGILMRWLFEHDMVLSNGYSIVHYPKGIDTDTLYKIEQTWQGDAEHKMGPLRPALDAKHKETYRIRDTEILEGKGVRQVYTNRAERVTDKAGKVTVKGQDKVLELLWLI